MGGATIIVRRLHRPFNLLDTATIRRHYHHAKIKILPAQNIKADHADQAILTLQNLDNQIPIELLLFVSECDRDSMAYVEAIRRLFQVDPYETLKCLMKKDDGNTIGNE